MTTANAALAQQQIANLQLASQIEQAQIQAQLQQQNAAVQNTALNNLAAALNLSIQPQMSQSNQNQAAAAALFQQNPFSRPFLPIFSFTSPWQFAAAAAAMQPLPERCIIQPAPVHVFQQPTVNVVVKPQTSMPVYSSHHHHHSHKSSYKTQKSDEVKITLNHSSPSKQTVHNSFHKSTSAPIIGVTTQGTSGSYQVKIKTEKPHRNTNYENAISSSSVPNASFPYPESLLGMNEEQQLYHLQKQFQQPANNFLLPNINNSDYFQKLIPNQKISPQQQQQLKSSPTNLSQKKHLVDNKHKIKNKAEEEKHLTIKLENIERAAVQQEEIIEIEIDDKSEGKDKNTIIEALPTPIEKNIADKVQTNENSCTINSRASSICSSSSSNVLHIDLDENQEQKQEDVVLIQKSLEQQIASNSSCSVINTNLNADTTSTSSSSSFTTNNVSIINETSANVVIPTALPSLDIGGKVISSSIPKLSQKFLSPSSTISHFFNEDDVYDNDNSISSFSISLKANRKAKMCQLWRTSGETFKKLISFNVSLTLIINKFLVLILFFDSQIASQSIVNALNQLFTKMRTKK